MTSSKQYLRSQHGGLGAVKRAGYRRAMALEPWATVQAARLIAPLGDRWTHVQAVADKARGVATVLPDEDADLLVAAAPVHDVGYARSLDRLGFGSGAGQELHPQGRRAVPHRIERMTSCGVPGPTRRWAGSSSQTGTPCGVGQRWSFTLDRYGHLYPDADQALRDRRDALHALTPTRRPARLDGPETDQVGSSQAEGSSEPPPPRR